MIIREIEKKDNKEVENLIRTCLIEYGADKPGCAWSDPNLGSFLELYQGEKSKYWVVEKDNKVVAQQFSNVYGLTASDLKAAANLAGSTQNIYKNSQSYSSMLTQLNTMADSM
jgi:hypothetical protein